MRWPSPFRDRDRRQGVELQLTPLIDCVFLLMVYFIWSSSFIVAEKMLASELTAAQSGGSGTPNQAPPPEADFDDVVIRVLWTGEGPAWQVNGAPALSLAELQKTMTTIASIKRDAPVVLHPDPDVPLGDVIDVLDLSRVVGFEQVKFAAAVEP
jgi:biopolymer transport protein ExbD